ncbi:TPR-like protein [Ascobolus immersus RN42]|uniref:TPR-like protein n=1 Tax=Ascobolus immersus RN42 TaxID=1160509 RepID=A0A3N4HXP4_ASCIM|nr:TPR-like protein [Ascobolus immersus RN42]
MQVAPGQLDLNGDEPMLDGEDLDDDLYAMDLEGLEDNSDDEDYAAFDAEGYGMDGEDDEEDEEDPGVDEEGIARLGEKEYEELSKEADEDDELFNEDMGEFLNDLRAAHGYKRKGRGKGTRNTEHQLAPEVRIMMGECNQEFASGNLEEAKRLVEKIVHSDPGVFGAWKILGEIYKERGDEKRCLQSWIMAAYARPKEWELWVDCAKMSIEFYGPGEQALQCYTRALQSQPDNTEIIFDRAMLFREMGLRNRAIDAFLNLLNKTPHDFRVLRELGKVLIEQGRLQDAIKYYLDSIDFYQRNGNVGDGSFGWSDLNILVEMYALAADWGTAISKTKSLGRWLYGRQQEVYWDTITDDDREWDKDDLPRRVMVAQFRHGRYPEQTYELPLELRVKLGICRLKLNHKEEAFMHFERLKDIQATVYYDLLQETADALFDCELYNAAIPYYNTIIIEVPALAQQDPRIFLNLAKCHREIGEIDVAEKAYFQVLDVDRDNTEARMQLAEMFEVSDRREEALELVNEVLAIKKIDEGVSIPIDPALMATGGDETALFIQRPDRPAGRTRRAALTAEQKAAMEKKKEESTLVKFKKLEVLQKGMEAGEENAVKEWIDTAADLVDEFRNIKKFYPQDKSKPFQGHIDTARVRAAKRGLEANMKRMQNRLLESLAYDDTEDTALPTKIFRGLKYSQWLTIFLQYALLLAQYEDARDSYSVLQSADDSIVWHRSESSKNSIYLTQLACAIISKDAEMASDLLRNWMHRHQFTNDVYRLFMACMLVTKEGREVFASNANQKYLLRQIKAVDKYLLLAAKNPGSSTSELASQIQNDADEEEDDDEPQTGGDDLSTPLINPTRIVGAASLTSRNPDGTPYIPTTYDLPLLMLYGHILSAGRGYVSALSYYSRAYAMDPENPLVALCIGLAYIHRSMQRQSENRSWEVVQGLSFVGEYFQGRIAQGDERAKREGKEAEIGGWRERGEAWFNLGRCLHQLGLSHLATGCYWEVLKCGPETQEDGVGERGDLKMEAAYMLQLIYVASGNTEEAKRITERYLCM